MPDPDAPCRNVSLLRLLWWALFSAAFGYVEAMTVFYIRRCMGMPPGWDYPAVWAARHLPFTPASVTAEMGRQGFLPIELGREAATLLLLLGAACAAGRSGRERLGLFGFTFALWDLSYYGWLLLFTGFPASPVATDIYFLLPMALVGPVWLPLAGMPVILLASLRLLTASPAETRRGMQRRSEP